MVAALLPTSRTTFGKHNQRPSGGVGRNASGGYIGEEATL